MHALQAVRLLSHWASVHRLTLVASVLSIQCLSLAFAVVAAARSTSSPQSFSQLVRAEPSYDVFSVQRVSGRG